MIDRFTDKWVLDTETGCHNWTAACYTKGYGVFRLGKNMVSAHRLAYSMEPGNTLDGTDVVRHTCDNVKCVNPKHLIKGSQADNMQDKVARNRQPQGEAVHNSKLTADDVFVIYTNSFNGMYQYEIAKLFKVTQTLISQIKRQIIWSHVTKRVVPL